MNRILAVALLLCALPTLSLAENKISLYSDMAGSQCEITDGGAVFQIIYVFLTGTAPATALYFSAPIPSCWQGATFITNGYPGYRGSLGNTQGNFLITLYPPGQLACPTPPVLACTIVVATAGGTTSCCEMRALGTADNPELWYSDCNPGSEYPLGSGQRITINPNSSCPCNQPLATEPTTWGRVKSLYR